MESEPKMDVKERLFDPYYLPEYQEVAEMDFKARDDWHQKMNDHEIWNREFISSLVSRMDSEIRKLLEQHPVGTIKILETCAGTGRLMHFVEATVREGFSEEENSRLIFKAIDNGSGSKKIQPVFRVDTEDNL